MTCTELLSSVVPAVCSNDVLTTLAISRKALQETAEQASEFTSTAAYWQLFAVTLVIASVLINHGRFVAWISLSLILLSMQLVYVAWQLTMIGVTMLMYSALTYGNVVFYVCESARRWMRGGDLRKRVELRRRLRCATSWQEYSEVGRELDELDGKAAWRSEPGGAAYQSNGVAAATQQLRAARTAGDAEALVRLLRTMMQRKHLGVDNQSLFIECRIGTKADVEAYVAEQVAALRWLRGVPIDVDGTDADGTGTDGNGGAADGAPRIALSEAIELFERSAVCLGHTALCLSGGGALSMYHMGVVKALLENGAMPMVVSGTSGGAIVAGVLAMYTDSEMLKDIIQDDIAVRFPERWFPPLEHQLLSYLKTGVLVQHDDFAACCKAYYGDTTFQEAYQRTGRVANINISVGSRPGATHRGALLLNHLTTPHVLLRSAVHASCCLPTVMNPTTLLAKTASGAIVPFEQDEADFIDGSFTADIPKQRLSELFHVTQSIVSQVNPHVVATMSTPHAGDAYSFFRRGQGILSSEVMHRLRILASLRLLPAMWGRDITVAMTQRYTGDVTIVPRLGGPAALLRVVSNPTKAMMHKYIREGQLAAFQRLSHIQHLLTLEQELHAGLASLLRRQTVEHAGAPAHEPPMAALQVAASLPRRAASFNVMTSANQVHCADSSSHGRPAHIQLDDHAARAAEATEAAPLTPSTDAVVPIRAASCPNNIDMTAMDDAEYRGAPSSPVEGRATTVTRGTGSPVAGLGWRSPPYSPSRVNSLSGDESGLEGGIHLSDYADGETSGGEGGATMGRTSNSLGCSRSPLHGDGGDKRRRAELLSLSMKNTKALQQIAREKEALHDQITAGTDALKVSEARRRAAERRVRQLERALRLVGGTVEKAVGASRVEAEDSMSEDQDGGQLSDGL